MKNTKENLIKRKSVLLGMKKKGKVNYVVVSFDIIGFSLIFIGAAIGRYANQEPLAIAGGFIMAIGVTTLALTRWISK